MRTQTEDERLAAAATLKEVMQKLEEALRLSRTLRQPIPDCRQAQDDTSGKGERGG